MRAAHSPTSRRGLASGLRLALYAAAALAALALWAAWPGELPPPVAPDVPSMPGFASSTANNFSVMGALHTAAKTTTSAVKSAAAKAGAAGDATTGGSWVKRTLCSDACPRANDGVCDDGRRGLRRGGGAGPADGPFAVACDLGTDCSDCGAWEFTGPRQALAWTPVKDIMAKKLQLHVRRTATPTPFWMPYTDPSADVDVSAQVAAQGLIELGLTWVWHRLLTAGCHAGVNGDRGLVLDVGANFGYYALLSAAMGCRVIAWEPVPHFAAFFKYGMLRNNLTGAISLRERIVSDRQDAELSMEVPTSGIWGTAGIGGTNLDDAQRAAGTQRVTRASERLDAAVPPQEVLIMKVDVEGWEPSVLRSAKGLLVHGDVRNLIMEYSPGVAETNRDWNLSADTAGKLLGLARAGYSVLQMPEPFRVASGFDWAGDLPPMPLVHPAALQHDVEDARRLAAGRHGCPLPPAVLAAGGLWDCPHPGFQIERTHSKGFRSTFGYNTNVWAFKGRAGPGVKGAPASLFPPDFDMRDYFSPHNRTFPRYPGHEGRLCEQVPAAEQVRLRCRCTDEAVCGAQARAVAAAARAGEMPPLPLERNVDPAEFDLSGW